jgi:hypothetical protein
MNNIKKEQAEVKNQKSIVNAINKRLNETCKAVQVKLVKIDNIDIELSAIKTQAKAIDFMIRCKCDYITIIDKLVSSKLCADNQSAIARLKRHNKFDLASRIIKRNVSAISHNAASNDI